MHLSIECERHTSNEQAFDCSVSYICVRTRYAGKKCFLGCFPSTLHSRNYAKITGHFEFVLKENSGREITGLS